MNWLIGAYPIADLLRNVAIHFKADSRYLKASYWRRDIRYNGVQYNDTLQKGFTCGTQNKQSQKMLRVSLSWVTHFYCYAECHYTESRRAECRGTVVLCQPDIWERYWKSRPSPMLFHNKFLQAFILIRQHFLLSISLAKRHS